MSSPHTRVTKYKKRGLGLLQMRREGSKSGSATNILQRTYEV